ncbi:hypothetical protein SCP_0700520 [Sparassis crispa]|uniref:Uncharacterized protein n=1 Tax=Sparassis crispa TaxID=139825 RepID=A0A401GRL5_9APHY|nr:hypothetical protein SCP_0700520 [Sparassis crispa]GBE84872.1 hypothetical protein SCP_0700520 [Sparassis crispa]
MGFFSSRRAELSETPLHDDKSVVRIIRSRFYGKAKGKERDTDSESYTRSPQSLSSPTLFHSGDRNSFVSTYDSGTGGPSRSTHWNGSSAPSTPSSLSRRGDHVGNTPTPRASTDAVTMTLAQRLNELATANSEGLLSDEEYRLLRQNLFERFASGSAVPTETPLVRMSGSHMAGDGRTSLHDRRPSSNFQIPSSRTHSVRSNKSLASTVTSLLRRATSKRVISMSPRGGADAISVFSISSSMASSAVDGGSSFPRTLSKHTSDGSIRTSMQQSRRHALSSEHTPHVPDSVTPSRSSTRTRQRSGSSVPPSSFPGAAAAALDTKYTHLSDDNLPSDDQAETVKDIRTQIELVEAEGRRLLDAFNGLELSTLTRRQRRPPVIPPLSLGNPIDVTGLNADRRSLRAGKDIDSLSFKSSGSIRTTRSMKRSPSSRKMRTATSTATLVSQPSHLVHRGSMSSMSSRSKAGGSVLQPHVGLASSSSVNLARSTGHLPLATVAETEGKASNSSRTSGTGKNWLDASADGLPASASGQSTAGKATGAEEDEEIQAMEAELTDIRKRRAGVTARYEARLEYLRARLKGAELREKILRK